MKEAKPARPAPLQLYDEPFKRCGDKVCLTAAEAKRSAANKVEIYNYVQGTNALLCYYEVRDGQTVCASGSASSH